MRSTSRHSRHIGVLLAGLVLGLAARGQAQITRVGATIDLIPGSPLARGNDTAFDPVNRVYLEVSSYGPVKGRFVNEAGTPVTAVFTIAPGTSAFAHYPRAIYSPHVAGNGGFLVIWPQNDGPIINQAPSNVVHARTVAYAANPVLGNDVVIGSSPTGVWSEAAPTGAYSVTSQQFLVVWQTFGSQEIHGVRVNTAGQPLGAPFAVSDTPARDPSVAWNPNANEFGVAYGGWDATSSTITFTRVRSSDGAVMRRNVVYRSNGTFMTDVAFNSTLGTFVVAYAGPGTRTSEVSAAGDLIGHGVLASSVGTYDGLAIAFNPISGTHVLVGHYTTEVGGVELDGHGAKIGVEQAVTAGGAATGSFYPRVSGNSVARLWHISFARDFAAAASQVVTTSPAPPTDSDGDGVVDANDSCPGVFAQTGNGCPVAAPVGGDYNGDQKQELVFVNQQTGQAFAWFMSGSTFTSGAFLYPNTDPGWTLVGTADLTGDGHADLLWQNNQTGAVRLFRMALQSPVGTQTVGLQVADPNWRIAGTADLNGDGKADIIWQHQTTTKFYVWFMTASGGQAGYQSGAFMTSNGAQVATGPGWRIVGAADFDGNGTKDIALQHTDGSLVIWGMNGTALTTQVSLGGVDPNWRVRAIGNFVGDAREDAVFQHATTGALYLWVRSGSSFTPYGFLTPGSVNPAWVLSGPK